MATYTLEQKRQIILTQPNKKIVRHGQQKHKLLKLHLYGDGMKEAMKRQEYFENLDIFKARSEYATSNKDLFARTLQQEDMVFMARGGSAHLGLSKDQEADVWELLANVRYGVSLHEWTRTFALQAYRSDPMGLIFIEVEQLYEVDGNQINTPQAYPTYKSIDTVHDYLPNGRRLEHICFQLSAEDLVEFGIKDPVYSPPAPMASTGGPAGANVDVPEVMKHYAGVGIPYFRFVDDAEDVILKMDNLQVIVVKDMAQKNPLPNPWQRVPAFIVSDLIQFNKPQVFLSPIEFTVELADCFLYDRSVRDLQKKYHGFAKAIEPILMCPTCGGEGFSHGNPCPDCTPLGADRGTGFKIKTKVSDVAKFPMDIFNKDTSGFDFRKIFGYVTPDIESWNKQDTSLQDIEDMIYYTYWGVSNPNKPAVQATGKDFRETATKTLVDLQPKYARLNRTADWAENCENMIVNIMVQFWLSMAGYNKSAIIFGRNYILESANDLMDQYYAMRRNGAPDFVLDEQMGRYIRKLYEASPQDMAKFLKLLSVEPFPHLDLTDAKNLVPLETDYNAKVYFGEWRDTLDDLYILETKAPDLRKALIAYVEAKGIPTEAQAAADAASMLASAQQKGQQAQQN